MRRFLKKIYRTAKSDRLFDGTRLNSKLARVLHLLCIFVSLPGKILKKNKVLDQSTSYSLFVFSFFLINSDFFALAFWLFPQLIPSNFLKKNSWTTKKSLFQNFNTFSSILFFYNFSQSINDHEIFIKITSFAFQSIKITKQKRAIKFSLTSIFWIYIH